MLEFCFIIEREWRYLRGRIQRNWTDRSALQIAGKSDSGRCMSSHEYCYNWPLQPLHRRMVAVAKISICDE